MNMHLALHVKIRPSKEQHAMLLQTMHRFNQACNHIAAIVFAERCANKVALQKLVYYEVRETFGLSAQLTIRAIAKVVEAYKRDKSIRPTFRPTGAIVYNQRILSWKGLEAVSLTTLEGRQIIPILLGGYQQARMDRIRGQADLIYRGGSFYLVVVVEIDLPEPEEPTGVLGVDLGMVNLAVDSDSEAYSGDQVEHVRKRIGRLRTRLQRKGTRSAKRHLKRLARKEQRFRRYTDHVISKKVVTKAKDTARAIALEDLQGIREQITVRKAQRSRHYSWSFYQLRQFIEYKATLAGVPVRFVNPRGTSQSCPQCQHTCKQNRQTRDRFHCVQCGFAGPADHIAALNIAARATVNLPIVACEDIKARAGIEMEHSYKPLRFSEG